VLASSSLSASAVTLLAAADAALASSGPVCSTHPRETAAEPALQPIK
jgi:hypothetical protein